MVATVPAHGAAPDDRHKQAARELVGRVMLSAHRLSLPRRRRGSSEAGGREAAGLPACRPQLRGKLIQLLGRGAALGRAGV